MRNKNENIDLRVQCSRNDFNVIFLKLIINYLELNNVFCVGTDQEGEKIKKNQSKNIFGCIISGINTITGHISVKLKNVVKKRLRNGDLWLEQQ